MLARNFRAKWKRTAMFIVPTDLLAHRSIRIDILLELLSVVTAVWKVSRARCAAALRYAVRGRGKRSSLNSVRHIRFGLLRSLRGRLKLTKEENDLSILNHCLMYTFSRCTSTRSDTRRGRFLTNGLCNKYTHCNKFTIRKLSRAA